MIVSAFLKSAPFILASALALQGPRLCAQGNMPAAPKERKKLATDLTNRFQVGLYVNATYNVLKGVYYGNCPCEFVKSGTGTSLPFGVTVNLPISDEASIYLRAGMNAPSIAFSSARNDSVQSPTTTKVYYDDLTVAVRMYYLEVLLRLIAEQDGFRIFAGPSVTFIRSQEVNLIETDAATGRAVTVEKGPLADARSTRYGFVLGIEYAFIPLPDIYLIPSLSFDYGMKNVSLTQPLRPLMYHFSLSLAYSF